VARTTFVVPVIIHPNILNDLSDDGVLACETGAKTELVISGDRHLLDLQIQQESRKVAAAEPIRATAYS
jgi:predicted nucleic acid-binding protein